MKLKSVFLATTALLAAGNALAVEASVYGQVNKLVASVDNGDERTTEIVDNDVSASRFGIKAQQQLDNGLTVSALLEFQSESNSSATTPFIDDDSNEESASSFTERHSRIGLASKFGTFLIGKTSEATDGVTESDLAGVQDVMYSDITSIGGAVKFVNKDGSDQDSTIANAYSTFDGGRTNLVRYDTPVYNGASLSSSITSGGDIALAAKFEGYATQDVKVKAAAGYKKHNSNAVANADYDINGSLSAKHETTGVAATVALGQREFTTTGREDAKFMYGKLSYSPVGTNLELAVDYAKNEKNLAAGGHVNAYGVGAQYNIAEGVSTSVLYRKVDASYNIANDSGTIGGNLENVDVITAGLRVKF